MDFTYYSHRYGYEIVSNNTITKEPYEKLCNMLSQISDEDIIRLFQMRKNTGKRDKSLSIVINQIIRERLIDLNWKTESTIFKDSEINATTSDWRLDFVYPELFSVEVAFNHGSAATVNLLKPVLASELNHVEKEFQTRFGIIITATRRLKAMGGFDNAIGTFEGYCLQTKPLMNQLTIPLIIIGLEPPTSFKIIHRKEGNRQIGYIEMIDTGIVLEKGDLI